MKITYFKSQPFFALILLSMAILISFDVYEDYQEGAHFQHLLIEALLLGLSAGAFFIVLIKYLTEQNKRKSLEADILQVNNEAEKLRQKLKENVMGLSQTIASQFETWGFTEAEKEVSFLLLKGLSLKEIAGLRETSEKTVQAQIQAIYGKSQIHSRSEFAAYFLEDLLPPKI